MRFHKIKFWCMMLCCLGFAGNAVAQHVITGVVKDTASLELAGVSVRVKDRNTIGTSTDMNGRYSLSLDRDVVLVFSMVGFETVEVATRNSEIIDVILKPSASILDDVVVTAFSGTQKRKDMIGSVVSISPSELKVPSSNLTTALAGRVAGLVAFQRSGEPGLDNAEFFIRGITTFANSRPDPLILIDGVELTVTDLARLQPDDIASFSVMKDATATAVYGARGANGVILVTTKEGKEGKAKINLRIESSFSSPTKNVEVADPVTYMQLANEAFLSRDGQGELPYHEQQIDGTIAGKNPLMYPANDWREILFKDYTMNHRANLSVSGGGQVARYYVAGSFNQDNGMLKVDRRNNFNTNIDLKSYTLRANVNINLTRSTEMIVRLNGNFDDYTGPIDGGKSMYNKVMQTNPVRFPPYYPIDENSRYVTHIMFGNYDNGQYLNPYADMVKGYKNYARSLMLAQLEVKQNLSFLTEGLSFRAMMNTNRTSFFDVVRQYEPFYYRRLFYNPHNDDYRIEPINENQGREYLDYTPGQKTLNSVFYLESALNYNRNFIDKHNLSGLLVFIMRNRLTANAPDLQRSLPYRNVGLSGRMTYSYDSRYYAEFNFGYNGSERFHHKNRFGFFPAMGIAWSVSNEAFWEPLKPVVNNLRLRATYGLVGNDNIGSGNDRFFYLSNVDMTTGGRAATFGRDNAYYRNGIMINRYSNPEITWEVDHQKNFALELGLFNKLQIQTEYFSRHRKNILMTRPRASQVGLAADIRANVGEAASKGVDMSVDYQHNWGQSSWLSIMGNFTYATSEYLVFEEPEYPTAPWRSRVGQSLGQTFGFIAEHLFIDEYEAANSPTQQWGAYGAGDLKYRDINGDGLITQEDRVPVGFPTTPEIIYGIGFSYGFKNFDVSAFFQGLGRESFYIDAVATFPFVNETQLLKAYADDHWSESNQNPYALWPRLSTTIRHNNTRQSTWFLRDGTFLRLKTAEVGYSLPIRINERLHFQNFRVYLNASNLLTWSKFKMWDVEMAGDGLGYPIQRVFNIGINVTL